MASNEIDAARKNSKEPEWAQYNSKLSIGRSKELEAARMNSKKLNEDLRNFKHTRNNSKA